MHLLFKLFVFAFWLIPAPWLTNFDQAKTEAGQSHKYILINFSGSDWCGPCIRMKKEIFESSTFESYATEKLVLVRADFPRLKKNQLPKDQMKANEALADRYNPEGKFPFTILTDESGKILKQWEGLPNETPEQFVNELNTAMNAPR
ncbi:thioredoxin family protein [Chitinophagaceae bacterium LB-8]|uniref:Thioredoxin family protein n=1 Tax=Paraflavisolibacter caeni TaxID=2982496 RepID=A0A9X3BF00_9BACT|nr:thioredoxin family protein [Paraflavisolibacter caeni]MCU7548004.1 thioredoxin family protein [Paraflavisolibacter caeni]